MTSLPLSWPVFIAGISGLFPGILLGLGEGIIYSCVVLKRRLSKDDVHPEIIKHILHVNRSISRWFMISGLALWVILFVINLILLRFSIYIVVYALSSLAMMVAFLLIMMVVVSLIRLPSLHTPATLTDGQNGFDL
jgi:hypothetical protein